MRHKISWKKVILLAVLLAIVGGIVYTVLTWPIYPQPQKSVDSYAQLRQDMEKTGVLVPPENVLPWVETFYSQELDGRDRLSKPRAFLMSWNTAVRHTGRRSSSLRNGASSGARRSRCGKTIG